MYEVVPYHQKSKWEEKLTRLEKQDIFYHHSYSNLYLSLEDGDPYLFYYEDDKDNKIGYVFIKRKIHRLPFVYQESITEDLYDIITPTYGYGGPLYDAANENLIKQFRMEFEDYCQKENIICEFIRFHPVLQNEKYMDDFVEVSFDRETIYIDLSKSEDEIFVHYHKNHKRNINKAIRNRLNFKVFMKEDALEVVKSFYKLYRETMDKLNASAFSYFSQEYIKNILNDFPNRSLIGAVFLGDKMIAAALCLFDGDCLHYHLGCSEKQYLNLGGNIFLLHQLAMWGKDCGLKSFHLGGGHVGRDSLFQYKYRFNSEGILNFYIGKKVHHPQIYQRLIKRWEDYYGEEAKMKFFPAYRNTPKRTSNV